jgi:hypothetical protein
MVARVRVVALLGDQHLDEDRKGWQCTTRIRSVPVLQITSPGKHFLTQELLQCTSLNMKPTCTASRSASEASAAADRSTRVAVGASRSQLSFSAAEATSMRFRQAARRASMARPAAALDSSNAWACWTEGALLALLLLRILDKVVLACFSACTNCAVVTVAGQGCRQIWSIKQRHMGCGNEIVVKSRTCWTDCWIAAEDVRLSANSPQSLSASPE